MKKTVARLAVGLGASAILLSAPVGAMAQGGPQQETRQANFGNLISALNNISAEVQALNNLNAQSIRIVTVDVDDVVQGNNVQAFNNALNRNDVTVLQNFLNNNNIPVAVEISRILNNANIAVNRVVAVNVLSGGDVIVLYQ
jgi:hypothetical protein